MSKNRHDRETDELLWNVAQSNDPQVREEFEKRYPHLRVELATRTTMIQVLKKTKPDVSPNFNSPVFYRNTVGQGARYAKPIWVAAILVGVAVLAFGSFRATQLLTQRPQKQAPSLLVPENPPVLKPTPVQESPPNSDMRELVPPVDKRGTSERPAELDSSKTTVSLPTSGLHVLDALETVVKQAGVKFTIMPGVGNDLIDLGDAASLGPTMSLSVTEFLDLLERTAKVRIVDNGDEGYIVFPLEKVQNDTSMPSTNPNGGPAVSQGG